MSDGAQLDAANAEFWNELCGTTLARAVGISENSPEELLRFDAAYLDFYPYLTGYLPRGQLSGVRVLELGLGYGTFGQLLIDREATYTGVDIADGPVEMMRHRIALAQRANVAVAMKASALTLPFADGAFDRVYSIGCLHHTGDLPRAVSEVRRVLRPGGEAVVMIYSRWSARRILRAPFAAVARAWRGDPDERLRRSFDADTRGRAAPHTEFASVKQVHRLFSAFNALRIERHNLSVPYAPRARHLLLRTRLDRMIGLDLYIRGTR